MNVSVKGSHINAGFQYSQHTGVFYEWFYSVRHRPDEHHRRRILRRVDALRSRSERDPVAVRRPASGQSRHQEDVESNLPRLVPFQHFCVVLSLLMFCVNVIAEGGLPLLLLLSPVNHMLIFICFWSIFTHFSCLMCINSEQWGCCIRSMHSQLTWQNSQMPPWVN